MSNVVLGLALTMPSIPTPPEIRELLLTAIASIRPSRPDDGSLQLNTVFGKVKQQLGGQLTVEVQQEMLTQWSDLIHTGYVAWGINLDNAAAPFFHVTARGQRSLQQLSRDPANPAGYLLHVSSAATLSTIADSYLREGLSCYGAGLFKSAAVMLGAASESMILELRDLVLARLAASGAVRAKRLSDWRAKTILDALHALFDSKKSGFTRELREDFEAYFLAFAQHIRSA